MQFAIVVKYLSTVNNTERTFIPFQSEKTKIFLKKRRFAKKNVVCVAGGFYGWAHRRAGHEGQNEWRSRGEMGREQRENCGKAAR